jgi:hypothetical protein
MRSCLYGLSYIENASKRKNLISLALLRLRVCALDFEWEQKNIKKNFRDKLSSLVSIYHLPIPDLILKYTLLTFYYLSYFAYRKQNGSRSMQEQWKGLRI